MEKVGSQPASQLSISCITQSLPPRIWEKKIKWKNFSSRSKIWFWFWPLLQNPRYKMRNMNTLIWFSRLRIIWFFLWSDFSLNHYSVKPQCLKVYIPYSPVVLSLKEVTMLCRVSCSIFFQKTDLGYSSIWIFTCQVCKCFGSLKGKIPDTPGKPGTWSLVLPRCFTSHWHGAQGEAQKERKQNPLLENLDCIVSSFK